MKIAIVTLVETDETDYRRLAQDTDAAAVNLKQCKGWVEGRIVGKAQDAIKWLERHT